jgi:hypothetical protein
VTDPFRFDGQQTIFPLLDPVLFADAAGYHPERLALNRELVIDHAAFWRAVDSYRLALSLNWTEVSEDSGVRQSVISRINCRKGKPSLETFAARCLWMGITDFRRFLVKS